MGINVVYCINRVVFKVYVEEKINKIEELLMV